LIPTIEKRDVTSSGMFESAPFGISAEHTVHVMTILRDTLYTDRILAVMREYASNAWDAHRSVGKLALLDRIKKVLST